MEGRDEELLELARSVRVHAHAPYSRFHVGAAVLADDGRVFAGVNVENSSYPVGICAEVNALGTAVTAGVKKVAAIAIVTPLSPVGEPGYPCGNCRQAIAELAGPDARIILSGPSKSDPSRVHSFRELLPHAFGPEAF